MEQSTRVLIGMRIKELRQKRGLTQDKLSHKVDIDPKHLSRIEVGRSFPSFDTLERMANALHVELRAFFEFKRNSKSTSELKKSVAELLKDADDDTLKFVEYLLKYSPWVR